MAALTRDTAFANAEKMRAEITRKAIEDPKFRARLIEDPKAVANEEFGFIIPEHIKVIVHESKIDELHFALPVSSEAMTDEQLDQIAAGLCCCI